jgi:hypothetical protein
MPDRLRARVLVTALLIMLAVAGIRAIGPAGDWARPAGDGLAVGLLLEVLLAAMFVALRWRRNPPAGGLAGKLNRIVSAALVTSFVGVLIGLILYKYNYKPGQLGHRAERLTVKPRAGLRTTKVTAHGGHLPPLRDVLIAILIIAIIVVLIAAWRRHRITRLRLEVPADIGVDEAADDLARAVESGRIALRDVDDARAAIIACYVAMEQTLAEARLTELFYEARYSTHHMPTSKRDRAERALADIAAELPASEPA